jgi:hypothetical protein
MGTSTILPAPIDPTNIGRTILLEPTYPLSLHRYGFGTTEPAIFAYFNILFCFWKNQMKPIDINYFAVVAAAVATFFLGWLWYSPVLFARQWMNAHGHTSEKLEQMKNNMGQAPGVPAAGNFVAAVVLAVLI